MLKRIFKETTIYAVGPQLPKIVGFFILPIITKDLTAYDYGIAALVSAYAGILTAMRALGLTDLFVNYYYKRPKFYKIIWKHLLGFLFSYSLVFALFQGLLLFLILPLSLKLKLMVIILNVIPIVLFENITVFGSRFLQLKQRPYPVAIISAISGFVIVFLNLYTISYLKMGFMGWFVSSLFGSLIQFAFYVLVLLKNRIMPVMRFRKKYLKKYLRISLPIVPNKYGHYLLNSSDRIVMDFMSISTHKIGLYNFGYNIGNYFQIIVNSLGIAIAPFYLKLISTGKLADLTTAKKLTQYIQLLFIFITFLGALWLRELFDILVSNDDLKLTYNIAIIIVMMQNYAPIRFFFTNYIVYNEKTTFLWRITLVGGIINVILNLLLIPLFGVLVAAITTFVTMFYISIAGYYHKKYKEIQKVELNPFFWFIMSSIATFIVYFLKDIETTNKILISVLLFIIITGLLMMSKKYLNNNYMKKKETL
ncbi:MAG: oligosaccharide flippase family protein [Flavobacteriales bacterium]|nr:oligosaccharide flippase family protein [Flavobacteriales bacterium]